MSLISFTKPLARICFSKRRDLIMFGKIQHQGGMVNQNGIKLKEAKEKEPAKLGDVVT